ncbi:hypothetical protein PoB_004469600 [Plakobranchus ocellatus]|uniref:Mos1 transposase HTH domain-containing protein n=1 Tax=Plakobranchus ocellatus TaxID=259542 RepID=A0AAV4B4B4_9GAST|nr:hypothetical protein PoB_004469600 [Plakobranchus ocellatus]
MHCFKGALTSSANKVHKRYSGKTGISGDIIEKLVARWRTSPQQGDLRHSGPPLGQGTGGGARTRDRRDLRADSLATVPSTPPD